jgi:hypothetical protein
VLQQVAYRLFCGHGVLLPDCQKLLDRICAHNRFSLRNQGYLVQSERLSVIGFKCSRHTMFG